jgi:hypothetical protein
VKKSNPKELKDTHTHKMHETNEANLDKPSSDIVKEFKANGNFDQFRKDCFTEITSQPSFEQLTLTVDDLVQKFLREQSQYLRKHEMRDLLRRRLNDNYQLNSGINALLNQIIDAKIETSFKPIIESMVNCLPTNHSELLSAADQASTHNSSLCKTEATLASTSTGQAHESKSLKIAAQSVSIEDFLNHSEKQQIAQNRVKVEKSKLPIGGAGGTVDSKPKKDLIKKEDTLLNKPVDVKKSPKPVQMVKTTANPKLPVANVHVQVAKKKLNEFEFLKSPTLVNESPLEKDPKNVFNFDWKIAPHVSLVKRVCLADDELTGNSSSSTRTSSSSSLNSSANTSSEMQKDSNDLNETL